VWFLRRSDCACNDDSRFFCWLPLLRGHPSLQQNTQWWSRGSVAHCCLLSCNFCAGKYKVLKRVDAAAKSGAGEPCCGYESLVTCPVLSAVRHTPEVLLFSLVLS
jgi:hypothetical protein